jgi:hypothetical protein
MESFREEVLGLEDSRRGMQVMRALKEGGGHRLKVVGQEMSTVDVDGGGRAAVDDAEDA